MATQPGMSTALRLFGLLDILSIHGMPVRHGNAGHGNAGVPLTSCHENVRHENVRHGNGGHGSAGVPPASTPRPSTNRSKKGKSSREADSHVCCAWKQYIFSVERLLAGETWERRSCHGNAGVLTWERWRPAGEHSTIKYKTS